MGRFGGYSTGYNPLLRSQMAVANTLRGGLSDLGQRPLDEAKFGLLEAKTLSDLSRQKKSDTRQQEQFDVEQPVRQMQLDKLKEQQAFENEPVRIGELFKLMYGKKEPDPETVMHMVSNDWQGDLMQATGGTIKDGVLYRKTGEPVTRKQLPQIVPFLGQIVGSNVNYGHLLNQKMSALEGRKNLAPEEKIKLEKLKAYKKDPNWLIDKYEMQNQKDAQVMAWLQGQGRKEFPYLKRNMETRTAKIARLREKAKAAEKRSAEQDARRFDRETQLMVKRLGNQAAGLKGAKPSTFQKEAEFYAEVTGITKSEAADILRADDTLGERLRLAAEEIKIVATRVENMDITASQATKEIETIKKTYGLSGERTLRGLPKDKGDPDDIRNLLLK